MTRPFAFLPATKLLVACIVIFSLGACAGGMDRDPSDGFNDPYETTNRKIHRFNKGLDRSLVRPAAKGYTNILPDEVEDRVSDFARNLGEPSILTNSLMQGDLRGAGIATVRFTINTTIGLFGLIDAASELGIEPHVTDFGETLFTWGVGEGSYIELPLLGPSTERHTAGRFVDLFTNPLSYIVGTPDAYYGTAAAAAAPLATAVSRKRTNKKDISQ